MICVIVGLISHLISKISTLNLLWASVSRERTVQPKLDRSDSVRFSRVRPAIQYRSSTDHLDGGEGAVSGYM